MQREGTARSLREDTIRRRGSLLSTSQEIAAAKCIQLAYRRQLMVFRHFGAELFCMWNGSSVPYGTINFVNSFMAKPAKFVACADTVSAAYISHFLCRRWRLPPPEVLITVVGGAQDFTLSRQLQKAFADGLSSAAMSSKAWILTGGTDTGVMKMVGSAMQASSGQVPVIGIGAWGTTNGRKMLQDARGIAVNYSADKANADGAPLNSSHTHFILVDSGREGRDAWGTEIAARSRIEDHLSGTKRVPLVQVVVQGGPGTMRSVASIACKHHPVIVMVDAGGAGTAIYQYVVNNVLDPRFQAVESALLQIKAANDECDGTLLTFFTLEGALTADHNDLSRYILQAIVSVMQWKSENNTERELVGLQSGELAEDSTPMHLDARASTSRLVRHLAKKAMKMDNKMITLAIDWDRTDIARELLTSKSRGKILPSQLVSRAAQRALVLRRVEFVAMLFDLPSCEMANIQMTPLYAASEAMLYRIADSDKALQQRMLERIAEVHDPTKSNRRHFKLYQEVVGPFLASIAPSFGAMVMESTRTTANDIFMWSVLTGNEELCKTLWVRCCKPVHMGLIAAALLAKIGNPKAGTVRQRIKRLERRMEDRALYVMDEITSHEMVSNLLLESTTNEPDPFVFGNKNLIDLAGSLGRKRVVEHHHSQAMLDLWWRGGHKSVSTVPVELPEDFSYWRLLIYSLLPFLNPYLGDQQLVKEEQMKKEAEGRQGWIDATLTLYKMHNFERNKAGGVTEEIGPYSSSERRSSEDLSVDKLAFRTATKSTPVEGLAIPGKEGAGILSDRTTGGSHAPTPLSKQQAAAMAAAEAAAAEKMAKNRRSSIFLPADESSATTKSLLGMQGYYGIPAVKFVLRLFVRYSFMGFYAAFITSHASDVQGVPGINSIEIAWMALELGFFLDQTHCGFVSGWKPRLQWKIAYLFAASGMLLRGLSIGLSHVPSAERDGVPLELFRAYQIVVSLNALTHSLELLPFITRLDQRFGVLVIVVENMIADLKLFLEYLAVVQIAFSLAFLGLARAGIHEFDGDFFTFDGTITIIAWSMYGWMDPDRFTSPVSFCLAWVYVLFVHVALVNLLVAMFTDTYRTVQRKAEDEYSYKKFMTTHLYLHVLICVPPPFNAPYVLWDLRPGWKKRVQREKEIIKCKYSEAKARYEDDDLSGQAAGIRDRVLKSIERQREEDDARLESISRAVPEAVASLDERWDIKLDTLRVLLESRLPSDNSAKETFYWEKEVPATTHERRQTCSPGINSTPRDRRQTCWPGTPTGVLTPKQRKSTPHRASRRVTSNTSEMLELEA